MRAVKVGDIEIGGETELFRHEKKFFNQTAYALVIEDDLDDHSIVERAKKLDEMKYRANWHCLRNRLNRSKIERGRTAVLRRGHTREGQQWIAASADER